MQIVESREQCEAMYQLNIIGGIVLFVIRGMSGSRMLVLVVLKKRKVFDSGGVLNEVD